MYYMPQSSIAAATVTVYGKQGCKLCESFIEKTEILGVSIIKVDVTDLQSVWGSDPQLAREAMSALCVVNESLPAVCIDGNVFGYSGAIREIKRRMKNEAGERKSGKTTNAGREGEGVASVNVSY